MIPKTLGDYILQRIANGERICGICADIGHNRSAVQELLRTIDPAAIITAKRDGIDARVSKNSDYMTALRLYARGHSYAEIHHAHPMRSRVFQLESVTRSRIYQQARIERQKVLKDVQQLRRSIISYVRIGIVDRTFLRKLYKDTEVVDLVLDVTLTRHAPTVVTIDTSTEVRP
jgi:hypothetical protein